MFNLLLKLGAAVIALLMAAVILAQHFGVSIGIRKANNLFTDLGDISVVSWLLLFLALLEFITLVLLVLSKRSARSK